MSLQDVAQAPAAVAQVPAPAAPPASDEQAPQRRVRRILGHLISLNGTHAMISCEMNGAEPGDYWSVGDLISVVHDGARLVGQVCDVNIPVGRWRADDINIALIKIELTGEIVDETPTKPVFHRGIRAFPTLGCIAHRIRAGDLKAIFAVERPRVVEIGKLSQNPTIGAMVSIDELTKRHFAVVGSTGVGKTTSVSMLVKQCVREAPDLRVLIVDPHNEYSAHFAKQGHVIDADSLDLPYWMFRFEEIVDIVYAGRKPNPDEADALYEVIRAAKQKFANGGKAPDASLRRSSAQESAWISADTPVPYRIADALAVLDEWSGKLDPRYARADLRTLRNRLDALSHDQRYRFMFGKVIVEDTMAKSIGAIFRLPLERRPVTIIQVGGLPNEVVNAVVSVLARLSFEVASACMGEVQVALLCEESHRYIPSNPDAGFEPTRRAIGRIAKEGRKYGASLCIVTQRPSELDQTVLSQCSTMFAMRLSNERDKDIMAEAGGASSQGTLNFLSSLADRECIAFGEAIPTPMRVKFADYRAFEQAMADRPPTRELPPERARELLRLIVSRMRGEVGPIEAPAPTAVRFAAAG